MEILGKEQEGSAPCPVVPPSPSFICVTAKSPKASAQFVLPETCTVQQFKEDIAQRFHCTASQLVLVFFGRILKDPATLRQCGIGDGMTVHLVIRPQRTEQEDPSLLPYVARMPVCAQGPSQSTLNLGSAQGSWGPPEAPLPGPEWSPVPTSETIIQKVRQVILANPEIQQLAQQVPSISHILNNADIMRVILDKMREIMDLARNPEMVPDLKGPDPALISLRRSIPGGDNPLRQLTGEMQEAGLPPGQDCFAANPYATLGRSPCPFPEQNTLRGQGAHLESPHGLPPQSSLASPSTTSICSDEGGLSGGWVNPLWHSPSSPSLAYCSGVEPFSVGCVPLNPDPAEIPMMIVNLCNAYTKRLMFNLMQNALQNAQAGQQEQIKDQVTSLSQRMQSPEMTAAMSNPTAIQAWVQMEQGLQTLLAEAPVLIPWFMLRLRGLESAAGGGLGPGITSCQDTAVNE